MEAVAQRPGGGAGGGWGALTVVGLGSFVAAFDGSAISVALPVLSRELDANLSQVQWVIAAYLIVVTAMLLNAGRLADMWGLRRAYGAGLCGFAVGSLLCGASTALWPLVAARAAQALGAALIIAIGPPIVAAAFPHGGSARGLGLMSSAMAAGLMAGPPLGGLVIDLLSWRWIFLVNAPLGLIGAWLALRGSREIVHGPRRFDVAGGLLLMVAVGAAFAALSELGRRGAPRGVAPLLLGAAAAGAVAFAWVERHARHPVVRGRLLLDAVVGPAVLCEGLGFVAVGGVMFLAPFYLAVVRGLRPLEVGGLFAAVPVSLAVAAFASGFSAGRVGAPRLVTLGLLACAGGLAALALAGTGGPVTDALFALMTVGAGVGLFQTPNSSMALSAAPRAEIGAAGGLLATSRNLGMALGVALAAGIFQASYRARTAGVVEQLDAALPGPFAAAFGDAMIASAACALAAAAVSLAARRKQVEVARA